MPRRYNVGINTRTFISIGRTAAVLLLGQVVFAGQYVFDPRWLIAVGGAIAVLLVTYLLPIAGQKNGLPAKGHAWARGLMVLGIAIAFFRLPLLYLFLTSRSAQPIVRPFAIMEMTAIVLATLSIWGRPRSLAPLCFPVLLAVFFMMGLWYLNLSHNPRIDVYVIQKLGCEALRSGHNPFAITFPDIYGPQAHYYPPSSVVHGVVQCGYFYPPLSLLLDLPAHALGDVRYAHLTAFVLTVAMCGYLRPRQQAVPRDFAPAILMLFTPGIFFVLENSWIEPFLLMMLTAATFFAIRRWLAPAAVSVGLLLSAKQYAPLALPAMALLLPRPWVARNNLRYIGLAVLAGAAVILPFFVWNPRAFLHSLTSIYVGILRTDSFSFLPLLAHSFGHRFSLAATAVVAVPAGLLVLWRGPRTVAGFAAGAAFIWLCIFAFSTQAFCNYYFLVVGSLCVSLAAASKNDADELVSPSTQDASP